MMGNEMRRGAELVERRTGQLMAIGDVDREAARRMLQEFIEQVVQTDVYPLEEYTPGRILEWWRRRHATEPRKW